MDGLDRSYLAFHSAGIVYLISLSEVERIVDESRETELSFVDFTQIADGRKREKKTGFQYGILLNSQKNEESIAIPGIIVEDIEGILEIEEPEEISLSEPVLSCHNQYLKAAVRVHRGESEILAFLLDPDRLREAALKQAQLSAEEGDLPDGQEECRSSTAGANHSQAAVHEMEIGSRKGWSVNIQEAGTEEPQYITLLRGGQTIYIDRDAVTAVVMRPVVQRVPGAGRGVQGISLYGKEMVVYYNPFVNEEGEDGAEGQEQSVCGVILRTGNGKLAGLAGEATGEAVFSIEDADEVMSLGNGVWVKKRD